MIGILYMVPAYFQDTRGMVVGQQKEEQGKLVFLFFCNTVSCHVHWPLVIG